MSLQIQQYIVLVGHDDLLSSSLWATCDPERARLSAPVYVDADVS